MPATARKPCDPASLPPGPNPGEAEYQVYGIQMTGKLEVCEDRRALAVDAADLHNDYVDRLAERIQPKTFWGWLGR